MERQKSLNRLTDEDLIKALENAEEQKPDDYTYRNDVLSFITTYKIEEGSHRVNRKVIRDLYRAWSNDPVPDVILYKELLDFFPVVIIGKRVFYLINIKVLDIKIHALKILESNQVDKTKSKSHQRHFESFLKSTGIQPGKTWLETRVLYFLYDKWTYNNNYKNPMGSTQFYNFCALYFPLKRKTDSKMLWLGIDEATLKAHLTDEQITLIKEVRANHAKEVDKKRKNKKKQGEIPRFKTRAKFKNSV